ncbi:MAG: glycosyltransferase [Chitinophagales bacterium]|nr:glycosyltransferase [Chitinophagales bacterium]MDW8428840.1 glycosyltransferase [Chitinophagales bacterium]
MSAPPHSVLIVLTTTFPYDQGEEHFEEELPFLCSAFEQVSVIPLGKGREQTRNVPTNCTVVPCFLEMLPWRWSSIFKPLPLRLLLTEFLQLLRSKNFSFLLQRMRIAVGTLGRAMQVLEKLSELKAAFPNSPVRIYYSYWFDHKALSLALLRKRDKTALCVSRAHAYDIYVERHRYHYLPFQKFKFSTLDAVYFISEYGKNYCLNRYGLTDDGKYVVARLGSPELKPDAKQSPEYAGHGRKRRLISVGKNATIKRNDLALEALARVSLQDVEYWCLGDLPSERPKLKKIVDQLSSERPDISLNFLGWLPRAQFIQLLRTEPFDLMLHLSATEGIPVSVMECLAAGIPVIATNVGGMPELIRDGENGFLLAPNPSPAEVARCIEKFFMLSNEQQQAMRQKAVAHWQSYFQAEDNHRRFAQALLALATKVMPSKVK